MNIKLFVTYIKEYDFFRPILTTNKIYPVVKLYRRNDHIEVLIVNDKKGITSLSEYDVEFEVK